MSAMKVACASHTAASLHSFECSDHHSKVPVHLPKSPPSLRCTRIMLVLWLNVNKGRGTGTGRATMIDRIPELRHLREFTGMVSRTKHRCLPSDMWVDSVIKYIWAYNRTLIMERTCSTSLFAVETAAERTMLSNISNSLDGSDVIPIRNHGRGGFSKYSI